MPVLTSTSATMDPGYYPSDPNDLATKEFVEDVKAGLPVAAINTSTLPDALYNTDYSFDLDKVGSITQQSGTPPNGIGVDADGHFSGKSLATGISAAFTLRATVPWLAPVDKVFTLTVNRKPVWTPVAVPRATVNVPYSLAIPVAWYPVGTVSVQSGSLGGFTQSYSAGVVTISGTLTTLGDINVTLRAQNTIGGSPWYEDLALSIGVDPDPNSIAGAFTINVAVDDATGIATITGLPSANAQNYRLYKDGTAVGSVLASPATTYSTLAAGVAVEFKMRAWVTDSALYTDSNAVTVTRQVTAPTFDWDATNAATAPQIGPAGTFARTGVKRFKNANGVADYAGGNEMVFSGTNVVRNFLSGTGTQSVTLRCRRYVVSVWGAGASVSVSGSLAGSPVAVSASTGASTDPSTNQVIIDVYVNGSGSVAGDTASITFTVSGSPTAIQCEPGTVGHAYTSTVQRIVPAGKSAALTFARAESPAASPGNTTNGMMCGTGWANMNTQNRTTDTGRSDDDGRLYQHKPAATATVVHATNGVSLSQTAGTWRCYVEIDKDSTRGAYVEIRNNTNSGSLFVAINPATGAINGNWTTGTTPPTYVSAAIREDGAGYWLHEIVYSIAATKSVSWHYGLLLNKTSNTDGDRTYTDTTSNFVGFWGTFCYQSTDAIVNLGLQADGARGQDTWSCATSSWYTAGDCTMEFTFTAGAVPSGDRYLWGFSGSASSGKVSSANKVVVTLGALSLTSANAVTAGAVVKGAVRLKSTDHALMVSVDSTPVTSSNAAASGSTATFYLHADSSGANPSNGSHIHFRYYPGARTNQQLIDYVGGGTVTPPVVNGRWNPGHFVRVTHDTARGENGTTNLARVMGKDLSNFKGFRFSFPWSELENDTADPNSPSFNWTKLDSMIASAKAGGFKVIIDVIDRTFWNSKFAPNYVPKSYGSTPQTSSYGIFKGWEAGTMDYFIRLLVAICGRYRAETAVLGILLEEISLGNVPERGANNENTPALYSAWYAQLKRIYPAVAAACPEFLIIQKMNWPYPDTDPNVLLGFVNALDVPAWGGAMSWPDTIASRKDDTATNSLSYSWYGVARANYTRIAVCPCIETASMGSSQTEINAARDAAYYLKGSHIMWSEYASDIGNAFFDRVIIAVNAVPTGYITAAPF